MADEREEALDDMLSAALELIKLIEIERGCASGGPSWHAVEVALLDIRDAWEGAKACEAGAARLMPDDRAKAREHNATAARQACECHAIR